MTLLKDLLNVGVQAADAKTLDGAFANEPDFLGGLEAISRILATQNLSPLTPLAGEPWKTIHHEMLHNNTAGLDAAFSTALNSWDVAVQVAISGAVSYRINDILQQTKIQGKKRKTTEYIQMLSNLGYQFRYNLCTFDIEVNGQAMSDPVESEINCALRDHDIFEVFVAKDAYTAEAWKNKYHPIRDYLCNLKFNGGDPIGELSSYFIDDQGVFAIWLRRWLIGAIARVMAHAQNRMLVMDGKQGMGKDHFVKWLCSPLPEYYKEGAIFPDDKDCRLRLLSTWIWDVNELGSTTRRSDREALKAFLTLETIRERKAWGHFDVRGPAITSFIGTINNEGGILSDPTGNRRFMIAHMTAIDWNYTSLDVDQVWAHAFELYLSGESWNLDPGEKQRAEEINEQYEVVDIVEETIKKYFVIDFTNPTLWMPSLEIMEVLKDPARGNLKAGSEIDTRRMAAALTKLGLKQERKHIGKTLPRGYPCIRLAP